MGGHLKKNLTEKWVDQKEAKRTKETIKDHKGPKETNKQTSSKERKIDQNLLFGLIDNGPTKLNNFESFNSVS